MNGLRIRFHRRTQKLELCYNWTKNLILFYLLFLQKAVKMLIDNIDKVPVSLVMMFFDVLLSFTQFVKAPQILYFFAVTDRLKMSCVS